MAGKSTRDAEPSEEAYWRAFYCVIGKDAGRVVKAVLLAKAGEGPGPEWRRVHAALEDLIEWQAKAIWQLALRDTLSNV